LLYCNPRIDEIKRHVCKAVLISVSLCVQHVVRPASKEYPDAAEVKGCIAIPCKSYGEELLRHLLNIHRDGILVIFFHSHFATIQIYQI